MESNEGKRQIKSEKEKLLDDIENIMERVWSHEISSKYPWVLDIFMW